MKNIQQAVSIFGLALIAILFSPHALAQSKETYRMETFSVGSNPEFSAETSGSSVKVVGTRNDEIVVRMYAKYRGDYVSAPNSEVEEFLEDFSVEIEKNGNQVRLITKNDSWMGWSWSDQKVSLSFEVEVPMETSTEFESSGGSISLLGVDGEHDLNTSGGSISIVDGRGDLTSRSSGGSFSMSNFQGDVSVKTSGGSVKISETSGDMEIHTSGGSVRLSDISGSIGAYTSGGSIVADLVEISDDLEFKSSGGSVKVTVPQTAALDLDIRGGRVSSDMKNFNGSRDKDRVNGELNGGGHGLTMQSSGGRVTLNFSN